MFKLILTTITATFLAAGASISVTPVSQNIALGGTTTVDITIGNLAANQVLGGYDLSVLYNSSILNALSITLLGALGPVVDNLSATSVATAGQADAAEVSFADVATLAGLQATQPFAIFRIAFQGIGAGTSTLTFATTPRILSDGAGNVISTVTADTGTITVDGGGGGVPEPSTWTLLATGAAILAWRVKARA